MRQPRQSGIALERGCALLLAVAVSLGLGVAGCNQQRAQRAEQSAEQAAEQAAPVPVATPTTHTAAAPAMQDHSRTQAQTQASAPSHAHAPGAAHQDHDSKHGGTFFMALDEKHHLEGVLIQPGTFRVYLYQEYTLPLTKAEVAKADAKVIWGAQDNAPETPMKLSTDGLALEAAAPAPAAPGAAKLGFPTELTLLIRFPGAAAGSRPEVFTFPFAQFTRAPAAHKH